LLRLISNKKNPDSRLLLKIWCCCNVVRDPYKQWWNPIYFSTIVDRSASIRAIVNYMKQLLAISVLFGYSIPIFNDWYLYLQVFKAVFSEMYCLLLSSRSRRKPIREFSSNRDNYSYVSDDGNTARKGNEWTHKPFLSASGLYVINLAKVLGTYTTYVIGMAKNKTKHDTFPTVSTRWNKENPIFVVCQSFERYIFNKIMKFYHIIIHNII